MFALTIAVKTQNISGIVVDDKNQPLMAANVYFISKPTHGKISDMDGRFSIPFTNENDTLVVAFIGYLHGSCFSSRSAKSNNQHASFNKY